MLFMRKEFPILGLKLKLCVGMERELAEKSINQTMDPGNQNSIVYLYI